MINNRGHGKQIDWYLFGIVLYELLVGITPFYSDDQATLFQNILEKEVQFYGEVSGEAKELIGRLLVKDPLKRLGAGEGSEEIKRHAFFRGIDWAAMGRRQYTVNRGEEGSFRGFSYTKNSK